MDGIAVAARASPRARTGACGMWVLVRMSKGNRSRRPERPRPRARSVRLGRCPGMRVAAARCTDAADAWRVATAETACRTRRHETRSSIKRRRPEAATQLPLEQVCQCDHRAVLHERTDELRADRK